MGTVWAVGLTENEVRAAYPDSQTLFCQYDDCKGSVQWVAKIRRDTLRNHVVDIYPGEEYCFVCGTLHPDFWDAL